jgi:hypothetical protein
VRLDISRDEVRAIVRFRFANAEELVEKANKDVDELNKYPELCRFVDKTEAAITELRRAHELARRLRR